MKKQTGKHAHESELYTRCNIDTGECISVNPEFAVMSLRPGLGTSWYERYKSDAFPSDFLIVEGKKHPVPRFYVNKLKAEAEYEYDLIMKKRRIARNETADDNSSDRLYTKMLCKKAQISTLKREI